VCVGTYKDWKCDGREGFIDHASSFVINPQFDQASAAPLARLKASLAVGLCYLNARQAIFGSSPDRQPHFRHSRWRVLCWINQEWSAVTF